jgi:hypothetical protein
MHEKKIVVNMETLELMHYMLILAHLDATVEDYHVNI